MIGILSLLGAMIAIGLRTYWTKLNPAPLRWLPASIGLFAFPVIALGSHIHLELGIVVLGFIWMWLAWLIWNKTSVKTERP
jgi:ABC-type glucose/galactose transport system permease subunit